MLIPEWLFAEDLLSAPPVVIISATSGSYDFAVGATTLAIGDPVRI